MFKHVSNTLPNEVLPFKGIYIYIYDIYILYNSHTLAYRAAVSLQESGGQPWFPGSLKEQQAVWRNSWPARPFLLSKMKYISLTSPSDQSEDGGDLEAEVLDI